MFWKFRVLFPTEPSWERYVLNSRPTSAAIQTLTEHKWLEAKNSLKQCILKFKKEALKVAAEQSPSTNIWFYRVLKVHIGHLKGDSPSDLKNAAEAVAGGTLYFCSDERRPLLKASTAPALALPSGDSDVNVLVYIVEWPLSKTECTLC